MAKQCSTCKAVRPDDEFARPPRNKIDKSTRIWKTCNDCAEYRSRRRSRRIAEIDLSPQQKFCETCKEAHPRSAFQYAGKEWSACYKSNAGEFRELSPDGKTKKCTDCLQCLPIAEFHPGGRVLEIHEIPVARLSLACRACRNARTAGSAESRWCCQCRLQQERKAFIRLGKEFKTCNNCAEKLTKLKSSITGENMKRCGRCRVERQRNDFIHKGKEYRRCNQCMEAVRAHEALLFQHTASRRAAGADIKRCRRCWQDHPRNDFFRNGKERSRCHQCSEWERAYRKSKILAQGKFQGLCNTGTSLPHPSLDVKDASTRHYHTAARSLLLPTTSIRRSHVLPIPAPSFLRNTALRLPFRGTIGLSMITRIASSVFSVCRKTRVL